MKSYNYLFLLFIGAALYLFSVISTGCAQIGSPTGGPRDTLPPVLMNSNPPNGTLHFKGNKIVLTFDEYVQITDVQKNLLVAPTPRVVPNVDFKLKTVTIRLRDTLQPNTTYNIQLGNSIQDINENNPYKNYAFVFSTGSFIDSLHLHGKVILAETGKADSTLLVFLYKNLGDSAVYKEKPVYIARVDSSGNFQFNHLAEGVYNIFALKDESGQKMYNNITQLFAFSDSTVIVGEQEPFVNLYAFAEEKSGTKPTVSATPAKNKGEEKNLKYTNSLSGGTQDLLGLLTLQFEHQLIDFDSSLIRLTDTLFNPFIPERVMLDTTRKIVQLQNKWTDNFHYRLIIDKAFAKDSSGLELAKSDTLKFVTKKENEYGSIKINFTNLDKFKHPVLQFVLNNEVVQSFPLNSKSWSQKLFKPGEYHLRILEDSNQNGLWDPGKYQDRRQPERVMSINQTLSIRANWDNERDIVL